MTDQPDLIRYGVLGALLRGMTLTYAARADGITVEQARRIAGDAGWPNDMAAVYSEHRRLREALGLPARPAARLPAGPRPTAPARPARRPRPPAPGPSRYLAHTPPRVIPELQPRPASSEVPKQESVQVTDVVPADEEWPAETCCPVPAATVAAALRPQWTVEGDRFVSSPPPEPEPQPVPEPEPEPEPEPPSGPAPCEVCGVNVSAAHIERTGRARHGHHKEDAG